jgi:hypothetical protein
MGEDDHHRDAGDGGVGRKGSTTCLEVFFASLALGASRLRGPRGGPGEGMRVLPYSGRLAVIMLLTCAAVAYVALACEVCSTGARHFLRELFRFVL